MPNDLDAIIYRGHRSVASAGPDPVLIVNGQGDELGVVHHVVKHSPTGMSWGFSGSGAADCARSILLAALGPEGSKCPACKGHAKIWFSEAGEEALTPELEKTTDPELTASCWDCEGTGIRNLPYQDFKAQHVARWGATWEITRVYVLAWLAARGITP